MWPPNVNIRNISKVGLDFSRYWLFKIKPNLVVVRIHAWNTLGMILCNAYLTSSQKTNVRGRILPHAQDARRHPSPTPSRWFTAPSSPPSPTPHRLHLYVPSATQRKAAQGWTHGLNREGEIGYLCLTTTQRHVAGILHLRSAQRRRSSRWDAVPWLQPAPCPLRRTGGQEAGRHMFVSTCDYCCKSPLYNIVYLSGWLSCSQLHMNWNMRCLLLYLYLSQHVVQ